jgi:hypothetical protein
VRWQFATEPIRFTVRVMWGRQLGVCRAGLDLRYGKFSLNFACIILVCSGPLFYSVTRNDGVWCLELYSSANKTFTEVQNCRRFFVTSVGTEILRKYRAVGSDQSERLSSSPHDHLRGTNFCLITVRSLFYLCPHGDSATWYSIHTCSMLRGSTLKKMFHYNFFLL